MVYEGWQQAGIVEKVAKKLINDGYAVTAFKWNGVDQAVIIIDKPLGEGKEKLINNVRVCWK